MATGDKDIHTEQREKMNDWTKALKKRSPKELLSLMLETASEEQWKSNIEDWIDEFSKEGKNKKERQWQKTALKKDLQAYITTFVKYKGSIKWLLYLAYALKLDERKDEIPKNLIVLRSELIELEKEDTEKTKEERQALKKQIETLKTKSNPSYQQDTTPPHLDLEGFLSDETNDKAQNFATTSSEKNSKPEELLGNVLFGRETEKAIIHLLFQETASKEQRKILRKAIPKVLLALMIFKRLKTKKTKAETKLEELMRSYGLRIFEYPYAPGAKQNEEIDFLACHQLFPIISPAECLNILEVILADKLNTSDSENNMISRVEKIENCLESLDPIERKERLRKLTLYVNKYNELIWSDNKKKSSSIITEIHQMYIEWIKEAINNILKNKKSNKISTRNNTLVLLLTQSAKIISKEDLYVEDIMKFLELIIKAANNIAKNNHIKQDDSLIMTYQSLLLHCARNLNKEKTEKPQIMNLVKVLKKVIDITTKDGNNVWNEKLMIVCKDLLSLCTDIFKKEKLSKQDTMIIVELLGKMGRHIEKYKNYNWYNDLLIAKDDLLSKCRENMIEKECAQQKTPNLVEFIKTPWKKIKTYRSSKSKAQGVTEQFQLTQEVTTGMSHAQGTTRNSYRFSHTKKIRRSIMPFLP